MKKDAQKYLQQKKKAMTEDEKENDKSIGHDSETVRKETCQNENQEGAVTNSMPNDVYITLDEYSDGNDKKHLGILQSYMGLT